MRKIRITEKQLLHILKETSYPLDLSTSSDMPCNASGVEVAVNNMDKDADNDVTITDNPSHKRALSNRLFARSRNICESNFDDNRNQNFGKNEKENIKKVANTNGGKMVKNLANDIENGGARNNTNQVRISRLEKQKKKDPVAFNNNGGAKVLNALKSSTKKECNRNASEPKQLNNSMDMQLKPLNNKTENHHSENEGNIYYY